MPKLTALFVANVTDPGRYGDGDGLFLEVGKRSGKSWIVRVQSEGKRYDYGLGSASKVSLAEAREQARVVRSQRVKGIDPRDERKKAAGIPTFREAALTVYNLHKGEWKNPKHSAQWWTTVETYALPKIGALKVSDITTGHILDVLEPIWTVKPETARRVRQRVVAVMDWAHGQGYRSDPLHVSAVNSALPKIKRTVRHHPAVEYDKAAAFLAKLRERETMGRLALQAVLLTACRSGEVRGAAWSEVDLDNALWSIPGNRMKAGQPHVVPLSTQAVAVFRRALELRTDKAKLVFPGARSGSPLSDMALLKVMRDLGLEEVPHGLRSTFRDWVSELTDYGADLADAALAHTIKNKVDRAYRRGKLLQKRRKLMQDWADYCEGNWSPPEADD